MLKRIIIYHYPCPDGIFAALASYLFFKNDLASTRFAAQEIFNKLNVQQLLPQNLEKNSVDVYMVDYCGKREDILEIVSKDEVKKLYVLDHHKTAIEMIAELNKEGIPEVQNKLCTVLDTTRSGATISYDYFKDLSPTKHIIENEEKEKYVETLYKYIEDVDLWKKQIADSVEFSKGLGSLELEYNYEKNPKIFDTLIDLDFDKVIELGKEKLKRDREIVQRECGNSFVVKLDGSEDFKCLACLTQEDLRSELGNALAIKSAAQSLRGIGAVAYIEKNMLNSEKMYKVSLRSIGEEDTTIISKKYGGGGHRNASSFNVDREVFMSWKA